MTLFAISVRPYAVVRSKVLWNCVALIAESIVRLLKKPPVCRSVRLVTGGATMTLQRVIVECLVFVREWPVILGVAVKAYRPRTLH